MNQRFAVVDIEATGAQIGTNEEMIQIACVIIENNEIVHTFDTLVNPGKTISPYITELTGISNDDVRTAPYFDEIAPMLYYLLEDTIFIAHNVAFDFPFLNEHFERMGYQPLAIKSMDTVELAQIIFPTMPSYHLPDLCDSLSIQMDQAHDALSDAKATAKLWLKLVDKACHLPSYTLKQLANLSHNLVNETGSFFDYCLSLVTENELNYKYVKVGQIVMRRPTEWPKSLSKQKTSDWESLKSQFLDHFDTRSSQIEMMDRIENYLNKDISESSQSIHLAIEAAAGVGKSLGYLLPVYSQTKLNNGRAVISTYTIHLQEQLQLMMEELNKALKMTPQITIFKSITHYLSLSRLSALLSEVKAEDSESFPIMQLLVWLTETTTGDLEEVNKGKYYQHSMWDRVRTHTGDPVLPMWYGTDFIHRRQQAILHADILLTNHAYFWHHWSEIKEEIGSGPYVFDEAHHLPELIYRQESQQFSFSKWLNKLEDFKAELLVELDLKIFMLNSQIQEHTKYFRNEMAVSASLLTELGKLLRSELRQWGSQYSEIMSHLTSQDWSLKIKQRVKQIIKTQNTLIENLKTLTDTSKELDYLNWTLDDLDYQAQWTQWQDWFKNINRLFDKIFLSSQDQQLVKELHLDKRDIILIYYQDYFDENWSQQWNDLGSAVYISSNLTENGQIDYFADLMKLDAVEYHAIPDPFDYQKQARIFLPEWGIHPKKQSKESMILQTNQVIAEMLGDISVKGIVLQNSLEDVELLYEQIKNEPALAHYQIWAQNISSSSNKLIRSFQNSEAGLLIGTVNFFEGLDLPDQKLEIAILPRLPFEAPDQPSVIARQKLAQIAPSEAFEKDLLPQMIFKLRQSFGRLLRSKDDKGVFVILDERFMEASYSERIYASLPEDLFIEKFSNKDMSGKIADFLKS